MRRLLISAAALALLAAPSFSAWAQPNRVGKASVAPDVQDRAQAELGHPPPPQQAAQPQGGGRGDRGDNRPDRGASRGPQAAPTAQPQATAPQQNRGDRGNWQGNRDRSNGRYDNNNRGGNNFNNRSGFNNPGYGGPRHDFRNFRDYGRSYNASRRYRAPYYRRPAGWYDHRWSFGEFLPSAFWARDYWLSNYSVYDLPPPPYGAVWVRVGSDALLVDEDSGEVITVAYGVFY